MPTDSTDTHSLAAYEQLVQKTGIRGITILRSNTEDDLIVRREAVETRLHVGSATPMYLLNAAMRLLDAGHGAPVPQPTNYPWEGAWPVSPQRAATIVCTLIGSGIRDMPEKSCVDIHEPLPHHGSMRLTVSGIPLDTKITIQNNVTRRTIPLPANVPGKGYVVRLFACALEDMGYVIVGDPQ